MLFSVRVLWFAVWFVLCFVCCMLCVVCWSLRRRFALFVVCRWLCVVCRVLVVVCCLLFVVCRVFVVTLVVCRMRFTSLCALCVVFVFGVRRLLFVVDWLLVLDRGSLFVVSWLLIGVCGGWSLLLVALFVLDVCRCGLLCAGCRQLFVVCRSLSFVVVVDYCRSLLLVVACCCLLLLVCYALFVVGAVFVLIQRCVRYVVCWLLFW